MNTEILVRNHQRDYMLTSTPECDGYDVPYCVVRDMSHQMVNVLSGSRVPTGKVRLRSPFLSFGVDLHVVKEEHDFPPLPRCRMLKSLDRVEPIPFTY